MPTSVGGRTIESKPVPPDSKGLGQYGPYKRTGLESNNASPIDMGNKLNKGHGGTDGLAGPYSAYAPAFQAFSPSIVPTVSSNPAASEDVNQARPGQPFSLYPGGEISLMPLVPDPSQSPLQRSRHSAKQMRVTIHRPSPPPHAPKRLALGLATPLASLALLLFAAAGILLYSGTSPPSQITTATDRSSEARSAAPGLSSPTVGSVDGARAIWELPAAPARAVLFVAHGCRCRPENFWWPSPRCPGCVGLPEDVAITARALRRRFAVLAVASAGECWSLGKEVSAAKRVIQSWTAKNGLGGLPVAALGASSGGYFVSRLAAEMSLAAVVIMIAEGAFRPSGAPAVFPPAMFLHMPKDQRRAALVERNAKMLRRNGVEVRELRSLELPLTPTLLSDRIPGLDHGLSDRIWKVFRDEGFVDENGYMKKDGRATPWKDAVVKRGFWEEVSRWAEHIQEELNLAYGYHEMTSLHADEMFNWIEEHLT